MLDQYRRWLDYERDAFAKALASLETVPHQARSSPDYQKAIDILAHLIGARRLWLARLEGSTLSMDKLFPKRADPGSLGPDARRTFDAWRAKLAELDGDDALRKRFGYTATEGGRWTTALDDVLTQLFTHSFYHRGQVASLVARCGGTPAVTDFIFWARERA